MSDSSMDWVNLDSRNERLVDAATLQARLAHPPAGSQAAEPALAAGPPSDLVHDGEPPPGAGPPSGLAGHPSALVHLAGLPPAAVPERGAGPEPHQGRTGKGRHRRTRTAAAAATAGVA